MSTSFSGNPYGTCPAPQAPQLMDLRFKATWRMWPWPYVRWPKATAGRRWRMDRLGRSSRNCRPCTGPPVGGEGKKLGKWWETNRKWWNMLGNIRKWLENSEQINETWWALMKEKYLDVVDGIMAKHRSSRCFCSACDLQILVAGNVESTTFGLETLILKIFQLGCVWKLGTNKPNRASWISPLFDDMGWPQLEICPLQNHLCIYTLYIFWIIFHHLCVIYI